MPINIENQALENLMSSPNAQRGCTFAFKLISFNHKECPILAKGRGILEFEKCVFADKGNSFAQAALFSEKPLYGVIILCSTSAYCNKQITGSLIQMHTR